jgi:cytochrome c oxidase subunit II
MRDSILAPAKDVVAGYAPVMPSFRGVVTEAEMVKLIAYLKSLSVPFTLNRGGTTGAPQ